MTIGLGFRFFEVSVPAYVCVETVRFVQLRVGWYRDLPGEAGLTLPVPVVNHPEAVVTAVAGELQEVRSPHSEGRIIEENVLRGKESTNWQTELQTEELAARGPRLT